MNFPAAFAKVLRVEGEFSDHPGDRGGATMYGITERVARANGYMGEMREMPLSVAQSIYKRQYWDTLKLDEISEASFVVACELFDTSVNMGVGTAGKFLQRAINVLTPGGVEVDGVVGPMTVDRLRGYLAKRGAEGEVVLLRALNALQGARYVEIGERDASQEAFTYGWFLNRVAMA